MPYKNPVLRTMKAISQEIMGEWPARIHDRLFISELIYGPLLRNDCAFSDIHKHHVVELLRFLRVPLIFCLPPLPVVERNVAQEHQMLGVHEKILEIYEDYEKYYAYFLARGLSVVGYDYTTQPVSSIMGTVDRYLDLRRQRSGDSYGEFADLRQLQGGDSGATS